MVLYNPVRGGQDENPGIIGCYQYWLNKESPNTTEYCSFFSPSVLIPMISDTITQDCSRLPSLYQGLVIELAISIEVGVKLTQYS